MGLESSSAAKGPNNMHSKTYWPFGLGIQIIILVPRKDVHETWLREDFRGRYSGNPKNFLAIRTQNGPAKDRKSHQNRAQHFPVQAPYTAPLWNSNYNLAPNGRRENDPLPVRSPLHPQWPAGIDPPRGPSPAHGCVPKHLCLDVNGRFASALCFRIASASFRTCCVCARNLNFRSTETRVRCVSL
jgi:hypothetical protein